MLRSPCSKGTKILNFLDFSQPFTVISDFLQGGLKPPVTVGPGMKSVTVQPLNKGIGRKIMKSKEKM